MTISCEGIPRIKTAYSIHGDGRIELYEEMIRKCLKKAMPENFFSNQSSIRLNLQKTLPFVRYDTPEKIPGNLTITSLHPYRQYSSKFVYDLISRWLLPGRRLNILMAFCTDFTFPDISDQVYILMEMLIHIDNDQDRLAIEKNLPIIANEINLGVCSFDQGNRILEIKGLSSDEKTALVQEMISSLVIRNPTHLGRDLFDEMQYLLVLCRDSFKTQREYRHIARIICWLYFIRRKLLSNKELSSTKRHVSLKLLPAKLSMSYGVKNTLGIIIGLSFLRENEFFGEKHILKAISSYVKDLRLVDHSFIRIVKGAGAPVTLYLEVEKPGGVKFTLQEIRRLKQNLPLELKDHIEQLMHPIFMPRNEEEIMRNILTLSNQLRSVKDLPQVIVSFDRQTDDHITFTVILLRVLKESDEAIVQNLELSGSFEVIPDRVKVVGYIRKKYPKEANVFHIKSLKSNFLRKDNSLDFYGAREAVMDSLVGAFGEVRDYNGGMLSKEKENFNALLKELEGKKNYNDLLLENFFYSLSPIMMRSVMEPAYLKVLFEMLSTSLHVSSFEDNGFDVQFKYGPNVVFIMIHANNSSFQTKINQSLNQFKLHRFQLASAFVNVDESYFLGLIFRSDNTEKQTLFCDAIRTALTFWSQKSFQSKK